MNLDYFKLNPFNDIFTRISSINHFIGTLTLNFLDGVKIIYRDLLSGGIYIENFLEYLRRIVWTCLPISTLTVSASAVVYSIHIAPEASTHGLSVYLGGVTALSLIREGVPVMASLAIVTQFCTGITAQIGSMKITEQLDAMKMSKVYPNAFLLVPMLLAGVVGFPIICLICTFVGLAVNFLFCNLLIGLTSHLYLTSIANAVQFKDIFLALTKTLVFGFFVTLISYTCGVLTVGGSKGVGSSTRLSVVLNFAIVVILDYIITALWI